MADEERTKHNPNIVRVALAIVEHRARWLVNRRLTEGFLYGLWEFPGGKIRIDETADQAAVRECLEEVAIEVEPCGALRMRIHHDDTGPVWLHPVRCRLVRGTAMPAEGKIGPIRWVDLDELESLAMPPANRAIITEIAERVLRRCGPQFKKPP